VEDASDITRRNPQPLLPRPKLPPIILSLLNGRFFLLSGGKGDRFLNHHELRPSAGTALNSYPHNSARVSINTRPRCTRVRGEQSLSGLL